MEELKEWGYALLGFGLIVGILVFVFTQTSLSGEKPQQAETVSCDRNYTGCVPVYPPDVDCNSVDGPVRVTGVDVHNLDGDGDGSACEPFIE